MIFIGLSSLGIRVKTRTLTTTFSERSSVFIEKGKKTVRLHSFRTKRPAHLVRLLLQINSRIGPKVVSLDLRIALWNINENRMPNVSYLELLLPIQLHNIEFLVERPYLTGVNKQDGLSNFLIEQEHSIWSKQRRRWNQSSLAAQITEMKFNKMLLFTDIWRYSVKLTKLGPLQFQQSMIMQHKPNMCIT